MTEEEYKALKPGDKVSITYEAEILDHSEWSSCGPHISIDHGNFVETGHVAPMFLINYGTVISQDLQGV